ncbi:MAG TPA: DUF5916 domain-containing protein [Longimicrobiaceae bacterium]|nr:DUF5916 domain-containing protein [Longimicrobiaceae bacterium]
MTLRRFLALSLLAAPLPASAAAQAAVDAAPAVRTLRAGRAEGMQVDGRLDEPAWSLAGIAGDFVQQRPDPGAPASERTEARVLLDEDALYVGMRMYDSHPDSVRAQLTRRDQPDAASDWARVYVDSYHDRRTAFIFWVNPRGVKVDWLRYNDGGGVDIGWDAVWDAAARVDSLGWTAELRIPLSQLRFSASRTAAGGAWGLNFAREVARRVETSFWAPIPPSSGAFVSLFGELRGLEHVREPRRLEVLPYTSARLARAPGDPADPFHAGNDVAGSVGADVKLGLTSGLTLSATLNPDFGQVEADPAVVNLTAFETFFPERRPFFTEGAEIFRFGQLSAYSRFGSTEFFYSRRIGRTPQGSVEVDDAVFVDAPDHSTILGAAKLSGRTAGGWTVGVLDALTQRETARYLTADRTGGSFPVEPLSNYFVGRVRRDLMDGRLVLGGLATATHRDLRGDAFDGLLRTSAYLSGVDGAYTWGGRAWTLSGLLAASSIRGSDAVVATAQRSSARYYQRPDAEHLRYRPGRTGLSGHTGALALQRSGPWSGSVVYEETSPGFEVNDMGYLSAADRRSVAAYLSRAVNRPSGPLRSYWVAGDAALAWSFGGERVHSVAGMNAEAVFRSLWHLGAHWDYTPGYLDDRLTRGGPLARRPGEWGTEVWGGSDPRRPLSVSGFYQHRGDAAGGHLRRGSLTLSLRPAASVQLRLQPSLRDERDPLQYLATHPDPLAGATFGSRYVLAEVDQTTVSLDTRLDWTFTPTLGLQLFAQPFGAAGEFSEFKELRAPRTLDYAVYGRGAGTIGRLQGGESCAGAYDGAPAAGEACYRVDPDGAGAAGAFTLADPTFALRSFRGNAVVRWEYRPGSTLYFVWQRQRSAEDASGALDPRRDLADLLGRPGESVFLVKATYWLDR